MIIYHNIISEDFAFLGGQNEKTKRNKAARRSITLFVIMTLTVAMCNFYVSAAESNNIYEETRDQLNIKYTSLSVDDDKLSIQVKDDNFVYRYLGNKKQKELSDILERYPETENVIVQTIQMGEQLGLGRLYMCILRTNLSGSSTAWRTINSYYVHTWKDLDISVSVSAHSGREVALSITPSISEKSWQVYSYVSFNF